MYLEPLVETQFHRDSYGYRPGKSAHDAVRTARQRCWEYDWVIDLDIKGFFDNLDHELVLRAVKKHTDTQWVLLYVERWLKAPIQLEDGTLQIRNCGSPQGSVISPLIANIFMHHAFDSWMQRTFPNVPFERYADDVLAHCNTKEQAEYVLAAIDRRLRQCKLELHPEKTRIIYCKDSRRRSSHEHERFDFLGFTFRARQFKTKHGKVGIGFNPAISDKAAKAIRSNMRSWHLCRRTSESLRELAQATNAQMQGWINYYCEFRKSDSYPTLALLNNHLVRWVRRKYKRFRHHATRAWTWLYRVSQHEPRLFAHWRLGLIPWAG
jgi:RNA-directed DNA polymerase